MSSINALGTLYKSALGSNPWVQIWIITMTELVADLNLKSFSTTNLSFHLFVGILLYIVLALELVVGFNTMGIAWLNGAWDGTSSLVSTVAGAALGEELKPLQWMGLALISAGLYCL
jgi:multidrug transporter EmrE-like cation transporter